MWWRRLRAGLGNSVMWAVGWAGVGAGLSLVYGLLGWEVLPFLKAVLGSTLSGFIAGGSFAVLLGAIERKRTLSDFRVSRILARQAERQELEAGALDNLEAG